MEWAGDYLVPRRPLGLAGFVGPRTLKRRVAALGRGVAREHDGYSAGAFFLCSGSGVRLAAAPLAVFVWGGEAVLSPPARFAWSGLEII